MQNGTETGRMFPIGIPYKRFSDPTQELGDSIRRQNALSVAWSERTGIPLDLTLTLEDRGVSGFKGITRSDPEQYALAAFLRAIEIGRAQTGDYLMIDTLDRLSSEEEVPATHLLTSILMKGIRVVQLSPYELELTDKSDGWTIMRAVMELSRGHGESKIKSVRVKAAAAQRRARAAAGEMALTGRLPAWLRLGKDGLPEVIPERASVVQWIFRLAGEYGIGVRGIAARLTREGVPAFTARQQVLDEKGNPCLTRTGRPRYQAVEGAVFGSGQWDCWYVRHILKDRRAVGELRTKDGTLVPLPAVVSEEEWAAAQVGRKGRAKKSGREAKGGVNLFTHLLHDAKSGCTYYIRDQGRGVPQTLNRSECEHGRASRDSFPLETFEEAILAHLREINPAQILRQERPDETTRLAQELKEVSAARKDLEEELFERRTTAKAAGRVLERLEEQERQLEEQLREARQKASHPLSESWGQAQSLIQIIRRDPEARLRLRALLRVIVQDIVLLVVKRGRDRLAAAQVWFAGGEHRDYLVLHRPPLCQPGRSRQPGLWRSRSLAHSSLDLHDTAQVKALEAELQALDLATLL